MNQKEKLDEWIKNNPDEYLRLLEEHKKKTQVCFHCDKPIYPIMYKDWAYLKDFKTIENKPLYVCREHATQEIYEEYKDKFLVEIYHTSKIYFYRDLYLPYFNAEYGYKNLDDCKNKMDHPEIIIAPRNIYSYDQIFYQNISEKDNNNV